MKEMLLLYWPTILAAMLMASSLSVLGAFLVTRNSSVQILSISQGSGLGVLIGILIVQRWMHDDHLEHTVWPFLLGVFAGMLSFALSERLTKYSHSKNAIFLSLYAFLWAANQLVASNFPSIENQTSSIFFGDLVTLGKREAFFFASISGAVLTYLILQWKPLAQRAFFLSILNETSSFRQSTDRYFLLVSLVLTSLSVQFLGLLFTLSALFIPTAVLSYSSVIGVRRHLLYCGSLAAMSAFVGFLLSLKFETFSTTPLIAVFLFLLPASTLLWSKK